MTPMYQTTQDRRTNYTSNQYTHQHKAVGGVTCQQQLNTP